MPFERSFETGRISVMKGSRQVLVKVVLFQLRGCGQPQDDAKPNFLQILNALYKGFQMAWHHPKGDHAPLTEKALLLLELVWSLS